MAKKLKFKPIEPSQEDVAHLRRKLSELVSRLQSDYDCYLKPLVKKMSEESLQQISESRKEFRRLIQKTDAVEFLTPWEVARKLHVLKFRVLEDLNANKVKGAIVDPDSGEWLIPASSVEDYGIQIGKINEQKTLIERFNARLDALVRKYNDLLWQYQSMAEKFTDQMYKTAKKKFLKQFDKQVGIDVMKQLGEKGLKEAFEQQVAMNVDLIKSIPAKYFGQIRDMVTRSTTGGFNYEGGLQKAIMDLGKTTRIKAKLIARDQSMKAVSTFTRLRFENLGSKKYIWHNSRDKRVAGNPNGLYPDPDKKSKYHGNHWDREGKVFEWNNPPPDGNPGMPINCRCWAEPIFEDDI